MCEVGLSDGLLNIMQGCDGSLLLDSTANQTAEKDDPINKTVEGYNLVDGIKRSMELLCPGVVSCADIVALAASAAVLQVLIQHHNSLSLSLSWNHVILILMSGNLVFGNLTS